MPTRLPTPPPAAKRYATPTPTARRCASATAIAPRACRAASATSWQTSACALADRRVGAGLAGDPHERRAPVFERRLVGPAPERAVKRGRLREPEQQRDVGERQLRAAHVVER